MWGNSNSNCTCITDKISKSKCSSTEQFVFIVCSLVHFVLLILIFMLAKRHCVWYDYPILQSSLCENRQMCIFYVLYLQCKENQNLSIQSISVSNSQDISISNSQCASVSIIWYHYLLLYLFTLLGIRPQSLSTISYEMMQIFYSSCLQATWSLVFQSQQLNPKL